MCWKESDRVSLRSEFVRLASAEGANRSELCSRFGISRRTGYKWLKRYDQSGVDGLHEVSRKPHQSPQQHVGLLHVAATNRWLVHQPILCCYL